MPQGSSASPGWFVTVTSRMRFTKGLQQQVAAYLDDVIVSTQVHRPTSKTYLVPGMCFLQTTGRASVVSSSPPQKAGLGAKDTDFLSSVTLPSGTRPNPDKLSYLTLMLMPI